VTRLALGIVIGLMTDLPLAPEIGLVLGALGGGPSRRDRAWKGAASPCELHSRRTIGSRAALAFDVEAGFAAEPGLAPASDEHQGRSSAELLLDEGSSRPSGSLRYTGGVILTPLGRRGTVFPGRATPLLLRVPDRGNPMEHDWLPDRSRESRERSRREIARMRDLRRRVNRTLSRQRTGQLGEHAQLRLEGDPPTPTDPERH
jgi:hypothetical protein